MDVVLRLAKVFKICCGFVPARGGRLQAQEGVVQPPRKHSLIQIYQFEDLPLIAMNVVRIGAQTPGHASGLGGTELTATIGFGPMIWVLITPDKPAEGFRSFDETEISGEDVPETEGDMLLFFSSDRPELNKALAGEVKELFGGQGELIEDVVIEGGDFADITGNREKVLIDNPKNLDAAQSSFVLTQRFTSHNENPCNLLQHSFPYNNETESGRLTLTFSNSPADLKRESEASTQPPVSRGLFFLPSLDLLTSLRMGGIRMGSLAINAKWKE